MSAKNKFKKVLFSFLILAPDFSGLADEILLTERNGVYIVPVTLNDSITVDGILDTGASEMFIPFNVIATLIQSTSIAMTDILKEGVYTLADGSINTKERVNIAKIVIGDTTFYNISAIVGAKNSQLLIGQNLLHTFDSYGIDNNRKILTLNNK